MEINLRVMVRLTSLIRVDGQIIRLGLRKSTALTLVQALGLLVLN